MMVLIRTLLASRYRMATFIAAYVSVFVLLAIFGAMLISNITQVHRISHGVSDGFVTDMTYYDLPRMTVSVGNGDGGGGKTGPRIRMDLALEVPRKDLDIVDGYQPHITENISDFMRTLKIDQVDNAQSVAWLHDALLKRINKALPVPVHEVFFRELLIM